MMVVTTSVDIVVDTVIQPMVSHPIYQPGPGRHVVVYT